MTVFSATMVLFYLAYADPDAVHRFIDRLHGHEGDTEEAAPAIAQTPRATRGGAVPAPSPPGTT